MKVALAQINTTVGDIDGNRDLVLRGIARAEEAQADLVVFPELCVFGYPPKDLLLRRHLIDRNVAAVEEIASRCRGTSAVIGFAESFSGPIGKGIFNSAALCTDRRVVGIYRKMLLPTYDVFDETRYFDTGTQPCVLPVRTRSAKTVNVGLTICEDLWNDQQFEGRQVYGIDPVQATADAGGQLIVNISGSPFRAGVQNQRERLFAEQVREHRAALVYLNLVGGNDDLIFDGASLVMDNTGRVVARAHAFEEDFVVVDLARPSAEAVVPYPERIESIRRALVLGLRDYVRKCRFRDVVIGLSGGIDSAVTAALAVEALGPDRVHGVAMPSRYSSGHSVEDAKALASALGVELRIIPIEQAHASMEALLAPHFEGCAPDVTEENVQARLRGNILMALSNKFGWLLLTTGNKSELGVGYCTLYGDMCGGLAVLSDVPKTTVYELAQLINRTAGRTLIPENTIAKPPSAELRENQTDQQSLPPYDVLDRILELYVEQEKSIDQIAACEIPRELVERIARMVDLSEYKRKQAPTGLKVTSRAFGTGRRMPIAARSSF